MLNFAIKSKIKFLLRLIENKISTTFYKSNIDIYNLKEQYKGATCIILGNGPSLKNIDNSLLKKYITFGSNGIFLKYTPDFYITISRDFYLNYISEINSLKSKYKFIEKSYEDIHTKNTIKIKCSWAVYGNFFDYNFPVPLDYSLRPDKLIYLGGSVIFGQIQLAQWMGFKKIILLGVDHNMVTDDKRQYGGVKLTEKDTKDIHFSKEYKSSMHSDIMATEHAFLLAKEQCEDAGISLLNATPGTKLEIVKKIKLESL